MTRTLQSSRVFFFFNDTATTEIYTLSLHDALPIFQAKVDVPLLGQEFQHGRRSALLGRGIRVEHSVGDELSFGVDGDRKSTRLNSSHANISYAVFCLKKKKLSDLVAATLLQKD